MLVRHERACDVVHRNGALVIRVPEGPFSKIFFVMANMGMCWMFGSCSTAHGACCDHSSTSTERPMNADRMNQSCGQVEIVGHARMPKIVPQAGGCCQKTPDRGTNHACARAILHEPKFGSNGQHNGACEQRCEPEPQLGVPSVVRSRGDAAAFPAGPHENQRREGTTTSVTSPTRYCGSMFLYT